MVNKGRKRFNNGERQMEKPKVSIIIPVYNVEKYLDRCIQSILNQTYKDLEVILVDDGSPDSCPQICDTFETKYENIRVVHKENGGLSSARLAGFKLAKGEYILFIDSDDYISKHMVEKLVSAIESKQADLAMCSYNIEHNGKKQEILLPYSCDTISGKTDIQNQYILPLIGNSRQGINIPGFLCIRLFRKSLIREDFFGSERIYYKEDHVFDLLYADYINKIALVNEPLYFYCFNDQSLSNSYRKDKWGMYKNLYKFNETYLEKRNVKDSERLTNFLISAIFASVDNAVMTGSYIKFMQEIKSLRNDSLAKRGISGDLQQTSTSHRLTIWMLKFRLYPLLYFFRKKRLEVAI